MKKISIICVFGAASILPACSMISPREVNKPSSISIPQAMAEIGCGLQELRMAQGDIRTGTIVSSMEVVLKLGVKAEDAKELTLDFSGSSRIGASGGASTASSANRENTITIKFESPLLAGEKTTIASANPARYDQILQLLSGTNSPFHVFSAASPNTQMGTENSTAAQAQSGTGSGEGTAMIRPLHQNMGPVRSEYCEKRAEQIEEFRRRN